MTEPTAPPDSGESAPEDAEFHSPRFQPTLRALLIFLVAVVVVGIFVFVGMKKNVGTRGVPSQSSRSGSDIGGSLRLNGATEAVQARAILAPLLAGEQVGTLTITRLAEAGQHVNRGDLLVEFDRQTQIRDYIDKQAEHGKLVDQVLEERAKEDAARAKDETEIKQAEDALSKAELEMEKVEIVSRIDAEKSQENLEEAKATLQQLRETFDLKRQAAQAAIRILEIQRDRTRDVMLHAQANADLMQVRSPIDGIVVLNTIWKQGKMGEVQNGDQVRPGVPFMQVVNPSKMQVRAAVNQQDFLNLRIGQTATVHLDAYPQLVFPGKLEEMAPIGRNGDFSSKLRTFTVVFSISGSDSKLMPDLSAAVDVHLAANDGSSGGIQ
jgi:multidrug efflux pump subunit AcrA (membrane-fusion protein)